MDCPDTRGHHDAGRALALGALVSTFLLAWPLDVRAQWSVTNLHPVGASASRATNVGAGGQVGTVVGGGVSHAAKWNGSAASCVDLDPGWAGATGSTASGVDGSQQVGFAYIGGGPGYAQASLWTGAAGSWVSLQPAGATWSYAMGARGGMQVGYAFFGGEGPHGGMWFGTGSSWVDLHPEWTGVTASHVAGTDGVHQVGQCTVAGLPRALVWYGSSASCIDVTPAAAEFAYCSAVHEGQQVGTAKVGDHLRASRWLGSASSWVDLNPSFAVYSQAYAVHGSQQAGYVMIQGAGLHASIWSGTSASCVDLHKFLPKRFTWSMARGIWHDATHTYVVGWANDPKAARDEAILWRRRT